MSLINRLFGEKGSKTTTEKLSVSPGNVNLTAIRELDAHIAKLLDSDAYIAKSDYLKFVDDRKETVAYFKQLHEDNLLESFCTNNRIKSKDIIKTIEMVGSIKSLTTEHNESFIAKKLESEKVYFEWNKTYLHLLTI